MNFDPKSRQQKIVEKLYPYFGELADKADEDEYALKICRHLLLLQGNAIHSDYVAPLITIWDAEHPEENSLTDEELIWGLEMLNDHITSQLREIQLKLVNSNNPRARFKVINGGMSATPDLPYPNTKKLGHEVGF